MRKSYIVALTITIPLNTKMKDEMIVITRPKLQSNRFYKQLIAAGIENDQLLISPVIKIKKLKTNPRIKSNSIILFTSENAISSWDCQNKEQFNCYCVGLNTTKIAKEAGLNSKFLGDDIKTFIKNFPKNGKKQYHYLRGKDVSFDLSLSLSKLGIKIKETVVYEQLPQSLDEKVKLLLQSKNTVRMTVFSNLSALAIINELDKIKFLNTEFVCLSSKIEQTLREQGITNTIAPNRPNVESLISILTN